MAELSIEVTGCGYDSNCVGTYLRFATFICRRYGERVALDYRENPDVTGEPLIVVKCGDGGEMHRWESVPSVAGLTEYLDRALGIPAKKAKEPDPAESCRILANIVQQDLLAAGGLGPW